MYHSGFKPLYIIYHSDSHLVGRVAQQFLVGRGNILLQSLIISTQQTHLIVIYAKPAPASLRCHHHRPQHHPAAACPKHHKAPLVNAFPDGLKGLAPDAL